ncbi:YIEGIA domain-containing protein [Bacillus smithii]|uniref:YIEGIA domain-containing protein n=1 Tax=Bacillus smithii TaxID=1479 RepID=UPI002E239D27|nr:YIEGIA domain-containing protein [Bacillus smithii]
MTGFVAAALGAVAIPAIMTKNLLQYRFLALPIHQFGDVRRAERQFKGFGEYRIYPKSRCIHRWYCEDFE